MLAADFVPGQLLLQFEPDTSAEDREMLIASAGMTVVQEFDFINAVLLETSSNGITELTQTLEQDPMIRVAQPNYLRTPTATPNDPLYPLQYGLNNTGQVPPDGTPGADINAPEAWDIFTGTSNAVVAVIDSGIDYNHPDLVGNLWRNLGEVPGNGIDDDSNGIIDDIVGADFMAMDGDPIDTDGHGTHVAGIIGAVGNNNEGVTGVNWDVQIMALKVGDATFSTAALLAAHNYMIVMKQQFGVNIVASNHSYGGNTFDAMELAALQQVADAGIPIITSAGNDAENTDIAVHFPSNYDIPGLISVGASTKDDLPADFSNFGETTVDLFAPGEDILSTYPFDEDTDDGVQDGYTLVSGTSQAAPYVTGSVALLASLAPNATPEELKSLILRGTDFIADLVDLSLTDGRLDLLDSMNLLPRSRATGRVFIDDNANGIQESNEPGLGGFTVFFDYNGNGALDSDEASTVTAADGSYTLTNLRGVGTFLVRQQPLPGFEQVFPANGAAQIVSFSALDQVVSNVNFGNRRQLGFVTGTTYLDADGDGVRDGNEVGMGGVFVYADLNNNGRSDITEPFGYSDSRGNYQILVPVVGDIVIRQRPQPGITQTGPANGVGQVVTLNAGTGVTDVDFGNAGQLFDFGNLDGYPTMLAQNGPRHGLLRNFQLGPTATGTADAVLGANPDNDGITFTGPNTLVASVSLGGHNRGYLQGWVDTNRNNLFEAGEKIISNMRLGEGDHTITYSLPAGVASGDYNARFRYGWEFNLGPVGLAQAGEVEDYTITVAGDSPTANDDFFTGANSVPPDSSTVLDVLANDSASRFGLPVVTPASGQFTTAQGGTVQVAADGSSVTYTPPRDASGNFIGFVGTDSFSYTITDPQGNQDSANVTVVVNPGFTGPLAVADRATTNVDTEVLIDVLDNDNLDFATLPVSLVASSDGSNGTTDIVGSMIRYSPDAGFRGFDNFSYQIRDADGNNSTATVTVVVGGGGDTSDDVVAFDFRFRNAMGDLITSAAEGDTVTVEVTVADTRLTPVPSAANDLRGVFAAYLDVLYDPNEVSLASSLNFNGDYPFLAEGNVLVPGLIDEAGAVQSISGGQPTPLGPGPKLLFSFQVTIDDASDGVAEFFSDPADLIGTDVPGDGPGEVSGVHDTQLIEPEGDVEIDQITFNVGTLTLTGATSEPPVALSGFYNRFNRFDVNGDSVVTNRDLLADVRYYLDHGTTIIDSQMLAAGNLLGIYPDVNNDSRIDPRDVLTLAQELLFRLSGEGEDAAEGEADATDPLSAAAFGAGPATETSAEEPVVNEASAAVPQVPVVGSRVLASQLARQQVDLALQSASNWLSPLGDWWNADDDDEEEGLWGNL